MARAYSQDLRDRVIDAAFSGKSARGSAAHFGVGVATAIIWVRRARETGERTAHRQGQPSRCKLDPHREFLLGLIEQTPDLECVSIGSLSHPAGDRPAEQAPDLTISELLERLAADCGVKASRSTLWTFLDRCGLTFKKNRARS